jgi:hypothetical protein
MRAHEGDWVGAAFARGHLKQEKWLLGQNWLAHHGRCGDQQSGAEQY